MFNTVKCVQLFIRSDETLHTCKTTKVSCVFFIRVCLKSWNWTTEICRLGQAALIHICTIRWDPLQASPSTAHCTRGAGHHICVGEGRRRVAVVVRRWVVVVGVPSGCGLAPWSQAECLLQQQVHLLSHFINGRLWAQSGGLWVAFQAPAVHVSPRPH